MIERLQRIARPLNRIGWLLLLFAGGSGMVLVASLVPNPWLQGDDWLIPSLLLLIWFLGLYSLAKLFISIPPPATSGSNWRQRVSLKLRRAGMTILGILFVGLTVGIMLLTYQLVRVSLM